MGLSVTEIDALIEAQRQIIRCARTTRDDDAFYRRSRQQLIDEIATLQLHLERLEAERANCNEVIASAQARIVVLKKARLAALAERKITKLLEMQRQLTALQRRCQRGA